jgi:FkbM family methyltransferase
MDYKIFYGIDTNLLDITQILFQKSCRQNVLYIPSNDTNRAQIFGDPIFGHTKYIFIYDNEGLKTVDDTKEVFIDLDNSALFIGRPIPSHIESIFPCYTERLAKIQEGININHGSLSEEYFEQLMSVTFIKGSESVLEIGGNIGRNSMVIASLLDDSSRMVVMETDPTSACKLYENRDLNGFKFNIVNAALSKRPLYQKGWDTVLYDTYQTFDEAEKQCWTKVNTVTYMELIEKFSIAFDTLVLDCEGAFFWILRDMPEVLNGIRLIIMENDYTDMNHKIEIDQTMKDQGFYRSYVEGGGWGPCEEFFYEVWQKTI